jgi:hypothetical protein
MGVRYSPTLFLGCSVLITLIPGIASPQWAQLGQDIDGTQESAESGTSVAFSSDGSLMAIGDPFYSETTFNELGRVRVREWDGVAGLWLQLGSAFVGEDSGEWLGFSVALSSDGSRVAVGAPGDGSGEAGLVRVFQWSDTNWVQLGGDLIGEAIGDRSGLSVALSSDGSWVAIGAPFNGGNAAYSGHVRVFEWIDPNWVQKGSDIDGEAAHDTSGRAVALSSDGSRVAVGAIHNGADSGHIRVFEYVESPTYEWVQMGQDIDGEAAGDRSGYSVALSSDGSRVAIGAPGNDGVGTDRGQVRVYGWDAFSTYLWLPEGQDLDGEGDSDHSGSSVALSSEGFRVAIGAPHNDDNGILAGQVRVYSTEIFVDGFESGNGLAWSSTFP